MESPDLIWLQMTFDPEGDLERVSRRIEELRPQRTTEVRGCGYLVPMSGVSAIMDVGM